MATSGTLDFEEIIAAIVESGLEGPLTLEYLPQYHHHLLEDALWVGLLKGGSEARADD